MKTNKIRLSFLPVLNNLFLLFLVSSASAQSKVAQNKIPKSSTAVVQFLYSTSFIVDDFAAFQKSDSSEIHFIIDDQNRKTLNEFWDPSYSGYDSLVERGELHTRLKNVGKKYEIEYVTEKIKNEDGEQTVNRIKSFYLYDSTYMLFKKSYLSWDANNARLSKLNAPPNNPESITKEFMNSIKAGDVTKLRTLICTENYLTQLEKTGETRERLRRIYKMETSVPLPEKEKTQFRQFYQLLLDEKAGETEPKSEIVDFVSSDRAVVCYKMNKSSYTIYTFLLDKIDGKWRIVDFDDRYSGLRIFPDKQQNNQQVKYFERKIGVQLFSEYIH